MQFFLDSCDVQRISELHDIGLVDGITTNPSLVAKSGRKHAELLKEICSIIKGPVSAQVLSSDASGMLSEAKELLQISEQIVIKVPSTWEGLKVCKQLTDNGHPVNVTLCFSTAQALLAAKAGATYISPFIGRLDDIGGDGMGMIADICMAFENYPDIATQVLVASVRSPLHVVEAAKIGADIVTLPPHLLGQMLQHSLTDRGLEAFMNDSKAH